MENIAACGGSEPREGHAAGQHRILRALSDSLKCHDGALALQVTQHFPTSPDRDGSLHM